MKALDGDEEGESSAGEEGLAESTPGHVWVGQGKSTIREEESARLRIAFARLQAHSTKLSELAGQLEVEPDAVDEEVHGIDYLVDSARRICRGADPIDTHNKVRLRHHTAELNRHAQQLRLPDLSRPEGMEGQLRVIEADIRHIHSHAERATFRRWAPARIDREDEAKDGDGAAATAAPRGLVVAVVVDSMVDGTLIGLASAE